LRVYHLSWNVTITQDKTASYPLYDLKLVLAKGQWECSTVRKVTVGGFTLAMPPSVGLKRDTSTLPTLL